MMAIHFPSLNSTLSLLFNNVSRKAVKPNNRPRETHFAAECYQFHGNGMKFTFSFLQTLLFVQITVKTNYDTHLGMLDVQNFQDSFHKHDFPGSGINIPGLLSSLLVWRSDGDTVAPRRVIDAVKL